jgi:phosphoribosylanthranilate isomerase
MPNSNRNDTKIKICGLTTEEDISLVNRLKTDFAGFVLFFPKSHRNLDIEKAAQLVKKLDGVKSVAVTVSPTAEQIRQIENAGFDLVQIHGEMSDEIYDSCNIPILKAFNVTDIDKTEKYNKMEKIYGYVFDAAEPGSGKTFDWEMLGKIDRGAECGKLTLLAGGLNAVNVARAIKAVKPDGVDVSSGVEKPEGGKDSILAERFVNAVRNA